MNILYITPPGIGKSPQILIAEELARRGHNITLVVSTSSVITKGDYDVVVGAIEASCVAAFESARAMKLPVYLHGEWVPPWRVGLSPYEEWGYPPGIPIGAENHIYIPYYKAIVQCLLQADAYSLAGHYSIKTVENFIGQKLNGALIMYPSVDYRAIRKIKDEMENINEEYQIITISRLVPHKKVTMTARALLLLRDPPQWVIIGQGPEEQSIRRLLKGSKVKVKFLGAFSGKRKFLEIKRSIFSVQNFSGIPPAEAMLLGKPCVSMAHQYMIELYGDTLRWGANNNIEEQAANIQYMIDNPEYRRTLASYGANKLLRGEINVTLAERVAAFIENVCEKIRK
jgi:glycosyltransferase involved in cell wall biosynthesis